MSIKTAASLRPRLDKAPRMATPAVSRAPAADRVTDERSEMFALMLADMDTRLTAIEQRTDRIATFA